MAWLVVRLTVVSDMDFESSYNSGLHGFWFVLKEWMTWPLGRLTVVDGMAFVSSYNSGLHGFCFVLK
jgi:hypothetical protein